MQTVRIICAFLSSEQACVMHCWHSSCFDAIASLAEPETGKREAAAMQCFTASKFCIPTFLAHTHPASFTCFGMLACQSVSRNTDVHVAVVSHCRLHRESTLGMLAHSLLILLLGAAQANAAGPVYGSCKIFGDADECESLSTSDASRTASSQGIAMFLRILSIRFLTATSAISLPGTRFT